MTPVLGGLFSSMSSKYDRIKFCLLTLSFAFIIGSYTIAKELKDCVFVGIVGKEWLPVAKLLVIFLLIPAALMYSYLVDVFRRYQLLAFYCLLYGVILALFALLLGNHTIGMYNTQTDPSRIFGWVFYFFLEGYSPFVVSVFWAFLNSVSSPDDAKNYYPMMVAGSKVGGIATALFAWYLLSNVTSLSFLGDVNHDVVSHQILMAIVAAMLLVVPILIYTLIRLVPGKYLHGYEAVYQMEKKAQHDEKPSAHSAFSGISVLTQSPYILGIFGLVFFYETLNVVLNFERIGLLKGASTSMAGFTAMMFWQRYQMHAWGMLLSFFGAQLLFKKLGVRRCLLLVPISIAALLAFFFSTYSADTVLFVFIALGTINYSVSYPLREALYIPATKDIKFKAKAWIDTFGTKFSKGFGSIFAKIASSMTAQASVLGMIYISFFGIMMTMWLVVAWILGKKYDKAISTNTIIGAETK